MSEIDFTTLKELDCPLLEQPTNDMCMGDLVKLLAFNTAILERMVLGSIVPAGIVSYFSGTVEDVPPRFLVCDGSYYDPTTYPELFEKIRYTYGRDINNCFAVPDLRVSIIQGVALESLCMDENEDSLWEGLTRETGAPVNGNVVGSRIKHENTDYFNSGKLPDEGDSIYGKMALHHPLDRAPGARSRGGGQLVGHRALGLTSLADPQLDDPAAGRELPRR